MPSGAINWLRRFKGGDPVRMTASATVQNRTANILNGIYGVGCRVVKPTNAEGRGWYIVVDGSSDIDLPDGYQLPWAKYDDVSININSDEDLQIYEWANASSNTGTPLDEDLFPYQDVSDGSLKYATLESIVGSVDVDGVSINKNSGQIQLYNWAAASAAGTPTSAALFPAKDGGATLKYYDIDDIAQYVIDGYVDGKYWVLGSNYTECYGVSIGAQSGTAGTPSAAVIELVAKQLVGDWEVTGTTAAGAATGALEVAGGIYAGKGARIVGDSAGTYAVSATRSDGGTVNSTGSIGETAQAGNFSRVDGLDAATALLATATYAVDATSKGINCTSGSSYYHGGIAGTTYTTQEIRLPLADGSYLAGYLRGGIFTAS